MFEYPYLHIITTEGCFANTCTFIVALDAKAQDLEELLRYVVLKMLKAEGKIIDTVIENMMSWRHSGFNVYCVKSGDTIPV